MEISVGACRRRCPFPPFLRVSTSTVLVLVIGKKVPESRGVRKFCIGAQIDTDLSPYIPIIPVFGCFLPEASRLFFPFPFGFLLDYNTVVKRELKV